MSWDKWVLDATMGWPPCFCPIEGDLDGEYTVITGMNVLAECPPSGKLVAVVHADGPGAVAAFCLEHQKDIQEIQAAIVRRDLEKQQPRKESDAMPRKKPAKKAKKSKKR